MAYLGRVKKVDLVTLVDELGLEVPDNPKCAQLADIIIKSDSYDEELIKNLLNRITSDREEIETRNREKADEQAAREFELKKLEIQSRNNITSNSNKCNIQKIMTKFETPGDIGVYLSLFERQITRIGLDRCDWVSNLLGLLPLEIVQFISREPDPNASDYDYVKKLLLRKYKLSTEQFRQKFATHRKDISSSWRDFAFEMNTFLDEWLAGLEIKTYEELKDLVIIDQIRKKLPHDLREHFCEELPKITKVETLINKLDDYEAARNDFRKVENFRKVEKQQINDFRKQPNRIAESHKTFYRNDTSRVSNEKGYQNSQKNNLNTKIRCFNCNEFSHKSSNCPRRKEGPICFRCKNVGHRSDECTYNASKNANTATGKKLNFSDKITKNVNILGQKIEALVDTGSEVNMASNDLYIALGRPKLYDNDLTLSGISNNKVTPLGFITVNVEIDNFCVNAIIYIISSFTHDLILGTNFLKKLNFNISEKGLKITGTRGKEVKVNYVNVLPQTTDRKDSHDQICHVTRNYVALRLATKDTPRVKKCTSYTNSVRIKQFSQNTSVCCDDSEKLQLSCQNECLRKNEDYAAESSDPTETVTADLAETANSISLKELDICHIMNNNIKKELTYLIDNYRPNKVKETNLKVNIILKDEIPVAQRPRRLAIPEQEFVNKQIQEWLDAGIIRESDSNYAAPIVLAKKKNNSFRLCIDYRALNKKIIKDNFPLPVIEEVLDKIEQAQVFTTLDLKNGFFHVDVAESSRKYTAFVTHDSQFEYNKLPFGLSLGPQSFQRYIQAVFKQLIREKIILVYMDDIIILAETDEEALIKLKRVLEVAADYGLEFNFAKCQFLKRKIEFLGYVIEKGTIRPSEAKTLAVKKFPEPRNIKQLHSFLGLTSYFRKYIPQYARIAKPLSDLLRTGNAFKFGPIEKDAFETLKEKLTNAPVLHIYKRGAKLELHTDASSIGFGSVLLQQDDNNNLHPIHYMSRKTSPTQAKYSSYELEALAVIESLKKFRNYLLGTKFKIITDCSAFQKTLDKKDLAPKVARWALFLQEFDYELVHRSGTQMRHVDALSRNTVLVVISSHDELIEKIKMAQQTDDYIQTILRLIEEKGSPEYFLKHEILYKYENDRELLVIPEIMQKEIIREAHNKGHYAVNKTESIIKENYFIPQLKKQIENVIANCVECILCNKKRGKGEGWLNPISKENIPLQTYHIDHIGPMPSTHKQYNHIFTVVDAFTKFIWLYPVKSTSAKEVIEKLKFQHNIFGNPSRIISDKGPAFTSNDFKIYCDEQNIEHLTITTGIPRANGQIERMHETLIPILSKLSIEDPTKWYRYVSSVQRIINSTVSRSTKYTPFELLTGVKLRDKNDLKIRELLDEQYLHVTMNEREKIRDIAKENILKIQEENRKTYNRKRKKANLYAVGELVAIQKTQFGTGMKLRPKFYGPYKIIKVKSNDRYDVKKVGCHEGPTLTSTAADHMKKWTVQ